MASELAARSGSGPDVPYMEEWPARLQTKRVRLKPMKTDVLVKLVRLIKGEEVVKSRHAKASPQVEHALHDSLNYDNFEDHVLAERLALDPEAAKMDRQLWWLRLFVTVLIALMVALTGIVLSTLITTLWNWRMGLLFRYLANGNPAGAFFSSTAVGVVYSSLAAGLIAFLAPQARASGVAYVLAYLNGTNLSEYFLWRPVTVKLVALALGIGSGLTLGVEGPFIFIGAGVGMLCAQSLPHLPWLRLNTMVARTIQSIKDQRVFIAAGMAAGLAVAFDAPLTGIIFTMEGATAFLTPTATIQIFSSAMLSRFIWQIFENGFSETVTHADTIVIVASATTSSFSWHILEIFNFIFLGLFGAVVGSMCLWVNIQVYKWRFHHFRHHPWRRVADCALWALLTASMWFGAAYMMGCRAKHAQCTDSDTSRGAVTRCVQLFCPDGFYNEMGSLLYSTREQAARVLFDRGLDDSNEISLLALFVSGTLFMVTATFSYGMSIPGGFFIPSILIGASFGRFWGVFMDGIMSEYLNINQGVYALVGAGAMFGGITRLALPAVIMLIEITGDATYLIPIMIATLLGKLLGDELYPPLYALQMQIEQLQSIGDHVSGEVSTLTVKDIMKYGIRSLRVVDKIHRIIATLYKSKASVLPVTNMDGTYAGLISRRAVIYALKYTSVYPTQEEALADVSSSAAANQCLYDAEAQMSGWNDITDYAASLNADMADRMYFGYISLRSFMDSGALCCYESTPAKRLHAYFHRVGSSHVCVLDTAGRVLGVVTRRHLLFGKRRTKDSAAGTGPSVMPRAPTSPPIDSNVRFTIPEETESELKLATSPIGLAARPLLAPSRSSTVVPSSSPSSLTEASDSSGSEVRAPLAVAVAARHIQPPSPSLIQRTRPPSMVQIAVESILHKTPELARRVSGQPPPLFTPSTAPIAELPESALQPASLSRESSHSSAGALRSPLRSPDVVGRGASAFVLPPSADNISTEPASSSNAAPQVSNSVLEMMFAPPSTEELDQAHKQDDQD